MEILGATVVFLPLTFQGKSGLLYSNEIKRRYENQYRIILKIRTLEFRKIVVTSPKTSLHSKILTIIGYVELFSIVI